MSFFTEKKRKNWCCKKCYIAICICLWVCRLAPKERCSWKGQTHSIHARRLNIQDNQEMLNGYRTSMRTFWNEKHLSFSYNLSANQKKMLPQSYIYFQIILCEANSIELPVPFQAHVGEVTLLESVVAVSKSSVPSDITDQIVSGGTDRYIKVWNVSVVIKKDKYLLSLSLYVKVRKCNKSWITPWCYKSVHWGIKGNVSNQVWTNILHRLVFELTVAIGSILIEPPELMHLLQP